MSDNAEQQKPHSSSSTGKKKTRRILLTLLAALFILVGVAWLFYWFLVLRHYQETDDAYVAGNQVQIISQVAGSVNKVWFDNTDFVRQGDVLVTLDKTDAEQAFEKAKTALATSVRQTHQLIINNKQYQATIDLHQTALEQAEADLKRREPLGAANLIGREDLQHARDAVATAKAELNVAVQQYNANQAMILNTTLENQPAVKQSAAALRDAWLALQRTEIVSPVEGFVSRRSVQVGGQISTSTPLMAVVPASGLWVDANFKETQLATVRIGQPVTLVSDIHGSDVTYHGTVAGLDMGTGSAFSLLPAQNATGNWIKVVQRLPVRITLDPQEVSAHPLRIGLSMQVSVDTKNTEGAALATQVRQSPAYQSDALLLNLTPVNQMINDIIRDNTSAD
ncbi:MAG: Multidrug export protein EmrA [Candidatus Erwinia impunctatus]|nr:Multidrug export protein EmrA [Culicoides impunctatus]